MTRSKIVRLSVYSLLVCANTRAWKCLSYAGIVPETLPPSSPPPRGGSLRRYRCIYAFTFLHIFLDRPVNVPRQCWSRCLREHANRLVQSRHRTWELEVIASPSSTSARAALHSRVSISGFSSASIPRSNLVLVWNASWKSYGTRDYYYWNNGVLHGFHYASHSLEIESRQTATVDFAAIVRLHLQSSLCQHVD